MLPLGTGDAGTDRLELVLGGVFDKSSSTLETAAFRTDNGVVLVETGAAAAVEPTHDERDPIEVSEEDEALFVGGRPGGGGGGAGAFFLGVRRKEDVSLSSANGFNVSS